MVEVKVRLRVEAELQERGKKQQQHDKLQEGAITTPLATGRRLKGSHTTSAWRLQNSPPTSFTALAGKKNLTSDEHKGRKFMIDPGNILFCVGILRIFFCDSLLHPEGELANVTCDWIVLQRRRFSEPVTLATGCDDRGSRWLSFAGLAASVGGVSRARPARASPQTRQCRGRRH